MDLNITDYMTSLQKHGVRALTFTLDEKMNVIVVAKQVLTNSSGLTSEHTHAHSGRSYEDAARKIAKDVAHVGENASKILSLNSN